MSERFIVVRPGSNRRHVNVSLRRRTYVRVSVNRGGAGTITSVNDQHGPIVELNAEDVGADPAGSAAAAGAAAEAAANQYTDTEIAALTAGDVGADPAGSAASAEVAAKSYADGLVVGLWDDRGSYNASVNTFPASGGSGSDGAIKKGDIWTVSVPGTLGSSVVTAGDTVRALVDTPGQTASNWAIAETNIGYVPENTVNKSTDGAFTENSDTLFPSQKASRTFVLANRGTYTLRFANQVATSPADGSTYYFGTFEQAGGSTTPATRKVPVPATGIIKAVVILINIAGVLGSSEDATLSIRADNTTDHLVNNAVKFNVASAIYLYTGLNIPITAGDNKYLEGKIVFPTYATNPLVTSWNMFAYVEAT